MKKRPEVKNNTGSWTTQEDQELRRLFSMYNGRWHIISREMNGSRTHKQIRDSNTEKFIIAEKCRTIGHKWALIANSLPVKGRTPLMIRNYWYSRKRQASYRIREKMSLDFLLTKNYKS
ncbi:hypothetical protein G9A89_003511 [Geosiphon pyriformis]|nr:hypothetical protein G9A89_003511 [Geosiphon pyriformis]